MKKKIRSFKNEKQERVFWQKHDSADYLDWSKGQGVIFPNLKLSTKAISIRLPESMISELRLLANKQDVSYQTLLKIFLAERIKEELYSSQRKRA